MARCGGAWKAGEDDDTSRQAEWEAVEALRMPLVEALEAALLEVLDGLAADVVERARAAEVAGSSAKANEMNVSAVFDAEAFIEAVERALGLAVAEAIRQGIESGALRIGAEVEAIVSALDAYGPAGGEALAEIVGKAREMADTTREIVAGVIREGIEERAGAETIAERLAEMFEELNPHRARAVAQTAVTGAWEAGQQAAFEAGGITHKAWLTRRDARVRPAHAVADGQQVPIDASFLVGGEGLRYPGDPAGSAANVINCRCTSRPVRPS